MHTHELKSKDLFVFSSFLLGAIIEKIEAIWKAGWRAWQARDKLPSAGFSLYRATPQGVVLDPAFVMQKRDPQAQFSEAYDKYADAIFRHCFFRLSDRDKAVEVMQETFMRAWNYLVEGKEVTHFRPFLYRIASNLIVEEYRKKKTVSLDAFLEEEGHDEGMIQGLRDDESVDRLTDVLDGKRALVAVEKLPPAYREVIVLRYVDGLSPKEIAAYLEERENTVSVRIHRALAQLKEILSTA